MTKEIPLLMAFAAGLLSFLSPCVLPLIPSYFSILAGVGIDKKSRVYGTAVGFILGFSVVFIIFGFLINSAFFIFSSAAMYINIAAGIIVIVLGLNIIFNFISFLNYEKRPFLESAFRKSSFIAGAAFAAGWTPCIGPILTGILLMAAQSGQTGTAVIYLGLYSLGFGIPFFLCAVFFDLYYKNSHRIKKYLPVIQRISGILLIIIGITILTGSYSAFNGIIQGWIFRYIDWAQSQAFPFRLFAGFLSWIQSF